MAALTRREILAGCLGLPLVWGTGCSSKSTLPPEGEIVGASNEAGHRIRDGYRPQPADDQWLDVRVVIVGGGIAGLTAAWRLKRAGFDDFVLLELEPQTGGTSRAGEVKGLPCPWGAHYLPVPMRANRSLVTLLKEMEVVEGEDADGEPIVGEQFLCRDPEERLFIDGTWCEGLFPQHAASADDLRQLQAFQEEMGRWANKRDGRRRRAFTIPVAACSDDPEFTILDKQSMSDWLAGNNFTSPRLRWLVDYSCRDDYGLTVEQTSAWAGLFYFASRVRKAGDEAQPLLTWPEGNGRLAAHLAVAVRDHCRTGRVVTEIDPPRTAAEKTASVVSFDSISNSVKGFRAERVIFAAPQFLAPHVIARYRDARGVDAAAFEYGAWLVANLYLKNRPAESGFPLAWDNVLYDSPSLGYVVATHQRDRDYGPTVFTYYYPFCDASPRAARERLLALEWRDCAELALSDLERAHPDLRPLVERLDVMRWGHAMILPRPGFMWGDARRAAAQPFANVHFAHSDLSGVALFEEAFYHGNRAAEEALAACGTSFETIL